MMKMPNLLDSMGLGNRKYKEEIQPHFKAMMELGISYEAAKPHIESGNLGFYKSL